MIIDFHTHIFPDRIAAAAVGKLQEAGQITAYSDGSAACLLASMERAGIDCSVLLPVATNPLKLASMNTAAIERLEQPGFIPFGAMHPDAPDWKQELGRLAAEGIRGIKIHPVYQGVDIDDIRYLRILGRAAELGMVTVTHAGDDIGFPGVMRCSPEMTRHALDQLGQVKLVLAHMGGWKNWERVAENLADTSAYLDTAFSLGTITPLSPERYSEAQCALMDETAFCKLTEAFGPERILFGTDSPWSDLKESVDAIRALPLSQTQLDQLFFKNACRLLNMACP